MFSVVGFL